MPSPFLQLHDDCPRLEDATLLVALSGWMDGGDVSTGTVQRLLDALDGNLVGEIDSDPFYILNFPGAMEVAALFRPSVTIDEGLIAQFEMPTNRFWCAPDRRIVGFVGKEPNLRWRDFADALIEAADRLGVKCICFVGSFGGTVPHTREPRLFCSVSDARLKPDLVKFGFKPSEYEGPASFATYLTTRAPAAGLEMVSLVAEVPSYLQGANPLSIEAMTRRLAAMLGLSVDLSELRTAATRWELKVTEAVAKDKELARHIRELEEKYDEELVESQGE